LYDEPPTFREHIDHITALTDLIDDDSVRVQILDAIEVLIENMNGPWQGGQARWSWAEVPDTIATLFDEDNDA
jgi:hypothetical protein